MSPVGDLTLSPGGLRVPARARSFLQFSAEDLVVVLRRSWASSGDCAAPRREDAVLGGGVLLRGFLQEIQCYSVWRFSIYQLESFLRSLWLHLSIFHLASALGLEGQRFSLRRVSGVIFGGGPFCLWFLGFVRSSEYR